MYNQEQIHTVIKEMFVARGYKICEEDEKKPELILASKGNKKISAFKQVVEQLKMETFNNHRGLLATYGINHGIIVYSNMTSAVKKLLTTTEDLKCQIETFHYDEVLFNITKHRLVPKHSKVDNNRAIALKNKYNSNLFPILKSTDPVSRFYAFKKGDLIKVVRNSGCVAYRIVR